MNTIIPIIIPTPAHIEDPKCPHCHEKLKGWSEPSELTFKEQLLSIVFGLVVAAQFIAVLAGSVEGSFNPCNQLGDKRYDYAIPTYVLSCQAERWITNEKFVTRAEQDIEYKKEGL